MSSGVNQKAQREKQSKTDGVVQVGAKSTDAIAQPESQARQSRIQTVTEKNADNENRYWKREDIEKFLLLPDEDGTTENVFSRNHPQDRCHYGERMHKRKRERKRTHQPKSEKKQVTRHYQNNHPNEKNKAQYQENIVLRCEPDP